MATRVPAPAVSGARVEPAVPPAGSINRTSASLALPQSAPLGPRGTSSVTHSADGAVAELIAAACTKTGGSRLPKGNDPSAAVTAASSAAAVALTPDSSAAPEEAAVP